MQTNKIHIGGRQNIIPENIILLEADVNYTKLYLNNGMKMCVATTLKELETRLSNESYFFRSGKSYIINLHYLVDYRIDSLEIMMKNDKRILVSRRRKNDFILKLNSFIKSCLVLK